MPIGDQQIFCVQHCDKTYDNLMTHIMHKLNENKLTM